MDRPEWWDWEFVLLPHVELRMEDREFSEVELRDMLERASRVEPDHVPGRWLAVTWHAGRTWCVVLEPDADDLQVTVITAFQRD